jgi:hypothetical protein
MVEGKMSDIFLPFIHIVVTEDCAHVNNLAMLLLLGR